MRELPATLALSILAHAAALTAYVAMVDPEAPGPVTQRASAVELLPPPTLVPDETPVEVALLDDDTVPQVPAAVASTMAAPGPPATPPVAVVTTMPTDELPPSRTPVTTTPPTKRPQMSMRGRSTEPKIHRPGSEGISDEMLEAMVDGTLRVKIANLPGARERAAYEAAQARLHDAGWVENATADELAAARLDRMAARQATTEVELEEQKDGTYTSDKTTFHAKVNRDGTVDITDKKNWRWTSIVSARFDVTDGLMRKYGQDPYASEKRRFLDRTREQRVEIGKRYRKEQLARSAQLMANNLARLWTTIADPAKRKDELLALWDECAETGDADLIAGGAEARRLLINWIHAKRIVFSPAELAAFNARKHSTATFAP